MTQTVKPSDPPVRLTLSAAVSTAVVTIVAAAGLWVVARGLPSSEAAQWWVLGMTLVLLAGAVVGLRYVDPRRMSLLKKCLIVSVLLHVLFAAGFSAVHVTRQVVRWARQEEPMTPTVNLQLSRELEVRQEIRQQVQEAATPVPLATPPLLQPQLDSPLPPASPGLEPVGAPGQPWRQPTARQNAIAPTVPAAPPAAALSLPLLPVRPDLPPLPASTPLPVPADSSRPQSHLPGPVNEQLAQATTPLAGIGGDVLGAPPAALPFVPGAVPGGSATGSGTGRPFSLAAGVAPPAANNGLPASLVPPPVSHLPAASVALPQRAFEERQRSLQKYGGTPQTEAAVARALVWLSRVQQTDGHWTKIMDRPGEPVVDAHDPALTGLAVLCFLAADHTPDKPGPYRETVRRGLNYLLTHQQKNGDLRGEGNMYDHAIATLAIAEAAAMTNVPAARDAARRAAQFIVEAQNHSGGWRYLPRDIAADTSVLGWQVLALHSAERAGFRVPAELPRRSLGWLDGVSAGKRGLLAGYANAIPTPPMTAEALFSRMLLGQPLDRAQLAEPSDYLLRSLPSRETLNYYYIYYGSLALMQAQGASWQKWNAHTSDLLLALQENQGADAGSWAPQGEWASRAGRVYTTALATLTLEVYYRYLPMYAEAQ